MTRLYSFVVNYLFSAAPEHSGGELSLLCLVWRSPRAFEWRPKLHYDSYGAAPERSGGGLRFLYLCLFGAAPERSGGGLSFTMTRMAQPPSVRVAA